MTREDATCPRRSSLSNHRIPSILTPLLSSSIHRRMVPGLYFSGAACMTKVRVVGGAPGGGICLFGVGVSGLVPFFFILKIHYILACSLWRLWRATLDRFGVLPFARVVVPPVVSAFWAPVVSGQRLPRMLHAGGVGGASVAVLLVGLHSVCMVESLVSAVRSR